jgi:mannosyltransferase OCH1-like enzyme
MGMFEMKVVILVPRRDDEGWRDKLWDYCKAIWQEKYDWPIFEGYHFKEEGPFNRSLAVNRAADLAGDWDVALIIDSDTVSEEEAVRNAVAHAWKTGDLSIAHNARLMLSQRATTNILNGHKVDLLRKVNVKKTYYDSISCAVAIRRQEWEDIGGFDERFEGWGFEDTAFRIAVETLTNRPLHIEQANCLHLWHPSSPEASQYAPTFARNHALKIRYERAHFQPERLRAIMAGEPDPGITYGAIPKILHRTVPAETSEQVEKWWEGFQLMHPDWELRTWRDPLSADDFPLTYHLHSRCANGAQKAGLVRLELLVTHGGVYVDSDVEAVRPLDALMHAPAFAAWEDEKVVPDAVMGAAPRHPAFREMLNMAISLIECGSQDAWETGPGISTSVLPGRDDVLLLPPSSFYPVHYKEKNALGSRNQNPWVFVEHKWHHSWSKQNSKIAAPVPVSLPLNIKAVICMPWRDNDDPWRQRAHDWCIEFWQESGLTVIEQSGESRAQMCNNAALAALTSEQDIDVLVFADADTWAPLNQVYEAIKLAASSEQLVHAFTSYVKLDSSRTRASTRSSPRRIKPAQLQRTAKGKSGHVSGLTAVPVSLWKQLGGFDQRFVGWGFEDQAFHLAAEVIGNGSKRIDGPAFHWYHRGDSTKQPVNSEDERVRLMQEYCQAAGRIPDQGRVARLSRSGIIDIDPCEPDAGRMQNVLSGPGGPLSRSNAVS